MTTQNKPICSAKKKKKEADLCSTLGLDEAKQGVAISNTPLRKKTLCQQTNKQTKVDTNTNKNTNRNGIETKVTD